MRYTDVEIRYLIENYEYLKEFIKNNNLINLKRKWK